MDNWYQIKNEDSVMSPALLFYPSRIRNNIRQMIKIAGSAARLRPHVKTYKCPEIVRMQMDAGIRMFKCATLMEAHMLAETSVPDVLVAYSLIGPTQKKFIELTKKYPDTRFSVLVDHNQHLDEWIGNDFKPEVFIDLDVGLQRTGTTPEKALSLYKSILTAGFSFRGLQIYDGNVYQSDPAERRTSVEKDFRPITDLIQSLKEHGESNIEVVCGGSITFPVHAEDPERILSPGTTLLWDHGYSSKFSDVKFDIAATVMTRVVSKPGSNRVCLDLGHKSIASEMSDLRVFFPQIPDAKRVVHSEEHLVLEVSNIDELGIGDVVYGYPWHICPTVALHEKAAVVENQQCIDYWDIVARKRMYQL